MRSRTLVIKPSAAENIPICRQAFRVPILQIITPVKRSRAKVSNKSRDRVGGLTAGQHQAGIDILVPWQAPSAYRAGANTVPEKRSSATGAAGAAAIDAAAAIRPLVPLPVRKTSRTIGAIV